MRSAGTVAELVQRQWGDHRPGLRHRDTVLSHHQVASGAAARAALLADLLSAGGEPHIGVLLDNTPEFPLWLSAAALAGAAVAGINPTRRGAELARDILHTDCRVLVTERAHLPLLDGLDLPGVRMLVTDTDAYAELLAPYAGVEPGDTARSDIGPGTRMLLYFTSGSTGAPKAAICTQGRLAAAGRSLVDHFGVRREDVHYICMPMFHGNAVIADWAPALAAGAAVALRSRFSASGFLDDVRAHGATYFTYVGRAVQYLLATPSARTTGSIRCGSASAPRPVRWTRPGSGSGSGYGWSRATARPRAARRSSGPRTPRSGRSGGRRPVTISRSWTRRPARSGPPPSSTGRAG